MSLDKKHFRLVTSHNKFRDIYDFFVAKSKESEQEKLESFAKFKFTDIETRFIDYAKNNQEVPFGIHRYFVSDYVHGMGKYGSIRKKVLDFIVDLNINTFFAMLLLLCVPVLITCGLGFVIFLGVMEFLLDREHRNLKENLLIEAYSDVDFFNELIDSGALEVIAYVSNKEFKLSN